MIQALSELRDNMQKLFESYLAGLIKHETRNNPTPLLSPTAIPGVFVIRENVGDAPTFIRVHVAPFLAPVLEPTAAPQLVVASAQPATVVAVVADTEDAASAGIDPAATE